MEKGGFPLLDPRLDAPLDEQHDLTGLTAVQISDSLSSRDVLTDYESAINLGKAGSADDVESTVASLSTT